MSPPLRQTPVGALVSPAHGVARLAAGNREFCAQSGENFDEWAHLAEGQSPFAAVLGCSDARVPVEWVFNQRPGDLFVVRVAGAVATPATMGSLEFAVHQLGVRLVVVLGHSGCGAVTATLAHLAGAPLASKGVQTLVEAIRPAVAPLWQPGADPSALLTPAIHAHVCSSVACVRDGLHALMPPADGVQVLGAFYDLASGRVTFESEADVPAH